MLILLFFWLVFILFFYFNYTSGLLQSCFQFRGSKITIIYGINRFPSWRRVTVGFLLGV